MEPVTMGLLALVGFGGYEYWKKRQVAHVSPGPAPVAPTTPSKPQPTGGGPSQTRPGWLMPVRTMQQILSLIGTGPATTDGTVPGSIPAGSTAWGTALPYYPPNQIDGLWGPITDKAVRQFQADNGLQVDGIVGPQTSAVTTAFVIVGPPPDYTVTHPGF